MLRDGLLICNFWIWIACWLIARNLYIDYRANVINARWTTLGLIYAMFVGGFEFMCLWLQLVFHNSIFLWALLMVGVIGMFNLTAILIIQYVIKFRSRRRG